MAINGKTFFSQQKLVLHASLKTQEWGPILTRRANGASLVETHSRLLYNWLLREDCFRTAAETPALTQ